METVAPALDADDLVVRVTSRAKLVSLLAGLVLGLPDRPGRTTAWTG
jgi:hypothetical protein